MPGLSSRQYVFHAATTNANANYHATHCTKQQFLPTRHLAFNFLVLSTVAGARYCYTS